MPEILRIENLRCGKCGAPRHLTGAAMWICGHCGTVVSTSGLLETMTAEGIRRGARLLFDPDRLDVRMMELGAVMGRAHARGDRERYRDAYREYLLQIQREPRVVPPWASTENLLADWLKHSVDAAVLAAFDPTIAAAAAELRAADVYQSSDPVSAARAYYQRCRSYARVILGHRDYPQWLHARCSIDQLARDTFVVSIRAFVSLMPPGTLTKIHCAVLGAELVASDGSAGRCRTCGGPRNAVEDRCRWCGADFQTHADPWLADFASRVDGMTARNADERAASALHLLFAAAYAGGTLPDANSCLEALRTAVPWASRDVLLASLETARLAFADHCDFPPLADALAAALSTWQPTAEPPEPIATHGPTRLEDAWNDPWVDMQIAIFEAGQTPPADAATAAVSMARLPHGAGRPITAALAAAFLLRLDLEPTDVANALALFASAAEGAEATFLHEVAGMIERRRRAQR